MNATMRRDYSNKLFSEVSPRNYIIVVDSDDRSVIKTRCTTFRYTKLPCVIERDFNFFTPIRKMCFFFVAGSKRSDITASISDYTTARQF